MKIGPFYFEARDIFLILAALLIMLALYIKIELWLFNPQTLLTLAILVLLTRGLIRSADSIMFFVHILIAISLAAFLPFLQVIIFYIAGLALMKLLRVI